VTDHGDDRAGRRAAGVTGSVHARPAETDVLVVGFGIAGAAAAIAAHDAGARVAIVEKTGAGGGNCVHSGGFVFDVDGPRAVDHLDALCFGMTDRSILEAFADGLHDVPAWIEALGGVAKPVDLAAFAGMLPSWPHFPGAGHVQYRRCGSGPELWRAVAAAVKARGIPVTYGTGAADLLTDDGRVTGATLTNGATIRARNGVVLACGGFEYDAELRDAHLPLPLVPLGHPGNTGDGIRMAQRAGASLWHMSACLGWFAFHHPDFAAAFPLDVHAPSFLYVDADGRRFADETGWEVHDKLRSLTAYLPRRANHPHLPGFLVFDEPARRAGPLNGIVGPPNAYTWSADNQTEIAQGWIHTADTPEELAHKIGVDPTTLTDTLARFGNENHDDFGRAPHTLVPLAPGPLYAIEIRPGVATASGGPRRDARARVLTPAREPIEGLYAAGGCGSIWGPPDRARRRADRRDRLRPHRRRASRTANCVLK
jgi:succinate dehydrogenase/fumarate reductase flavoprotein subunit